MAFSRGDCENAIEEFEVATDVRISPPLALIQGGRNVARVFDSKLSGAGCVSTRVRVLASRYPDEMEPVVERIEKLAEAVQGNELMEEAFDAVCVTWYLADTTDDAEALNRLKADIAWLEKKLGC